MPEWPPSDAALPAESPAAAAPAPAWRAGMAVARKLLAAVLAVFLFVFALSLIKDGAADLAPSLQAWLRPGAAWSAFGFGWLMAYVVMSGSPVAATALGLYAGGVLDTLGLYAMVAGSRFGAAFIVLALGFLYALRPAHRRGRALGLHAGVLSLLVTWTIYGPGVLVGLLLLHSRVLEPFAVPMPAGLLDLIEGTFGAAAGWVASHAPHAALVLVLGVAAVVGSFRLFDHALPDVKGRAGRLGAMAERIYRPLVMFAFGLAVTGLTLSVSVSLGLLVPLTVKGVVRRENLVPYVMGANVGTFLDTLVASMVVGGQTAFLVVFSELAGVLVTSLGVLAVGFSHYEFALHRATAAVLRDRRRLAVFLTVILICPAVLLLL